ncbi:MAG: hypothetical protein ACR2JE_15310 [Acidobacteriaceae bacterium]
MIDVVTAMQQIIQDLVAPDLKAANTKLEGLKELVEANDRHAQELIEASQKHTRS